MRYMQTIKLDGSTTNNLSIGISNEKLEELIGTNQELRYLITTLLEKGIKGADGTEKIGGGGGNAPGTNVKMNTQHLNTRNYFEGQFKPPMPGQMFEGEIAYGISNKFGRSQINVVNKDGQRGLSESTVYEHAFLQLQLVETFEENDRLQE